MRKTTAQHQETIKKIAVKWQLTDLEPITETSRAFVLKVTGPMGHAVLKYYKRWHRAGEGAASHFMRSLKPGVGPIIYRDSLWHTSVLMEWLDGPTLNSLIREGQDVQAAEMFTDVARGILDSKFLVPPMYNRKMPKLKKSLAELNAHPNPDQLRRVRDLGCHLAKTTTRERILHGDLHGDNIIITPNGPRLIDPKGVRADPALEFSKVLLRPIHDLATPDLIKRAQERAAIFAPTIDVEPLRLIQWAAMVLGHSTLRRTAKSPSEPLEEQLVKALLDLSER